MSSSIHVGDPFHQFVEGPEVAAGLCELSQPLSKGVVEGAALLSGKDAGLIDQVVVGAESNVSHLFSVHWVRAHCNRLGLGLQTGILTRLSYLNEIKRALINS